jgi:hypothetical protein
MCTATSDTLNTLGVRLMLSIDNISLTPVVVNLWDPKCYFKYLKYGSKMA